MLFVLRTTVVAGGGPAAAHFLCFAKKVSKERRPRFAAPLRGVPVDATHKSGRETNSLRSDKFPFFIRFMRVTNGDS